MGTGVGLISQQVLQIDGQAVTGRNAQHQRPRTLVGPQRYLARHRRAALGQRHIVVVDHIAAQGVDHAVDVLRAEAVEHQRLIQRHDVRHQIAFAACSGFGELDAEQRRKKQQQVYQVMSVGDTGHDHGPRCGGSQGMVLDKSL
ncbi:hypothetical protein D3C73_1300340 [compost metagenome]